ncbi:CRACD-like protein isoform X2 [Hippocampus zosterae]|uniref:CRACD-like protein isoform X2 n=1 Tax=Hippocampus zosterae TaxID=109293 RepID=UPI00223CD7E4|nr:CRACD-like protein isoform X2 [Hippocampus zosterae]
MHTCTNNFTSRQREVIASQKFKGDLRVSAVAQSRKTSFIVSTKIVIILQHGRNVWMLQEQKMKRRMSPWGVSFGSGRSDPAAMASGPPDVMANQEPAEIAEECSGKKKSKFQTFKNFFVRKKKKEPSGDDAELQGSQSSDNISKTSKNNTLSRSEKEKGSKISLGSKALSHDSVFVSDSSEANEALGASQDSIHGKVKSLQLQLKQAIRLGSPPSLMCVKRTEDAGTMSEDDGLPCSPPESTSSQAAMLSCAASSRAVSPLVTVPGDFSQPASPFGCLDNSAAKHKLGLRHKACNRRKPANRLEIKSEGHNGMDGTLSIRFPESLEAQEEVKIRDVNGHALEQKVKVEEEDPEKERPLLQGAEVEDESEADQDVSLAQDTACQSEAIEADIQSPPSPDLSARSSSLDSPRATPEPPVDHEDFPEHSLVNGNEENTDGPYLVEDNGFEEGVEDDSSFLQEVLSSLKTPLPSCTSCVDSDDVVLEVTQEDNETEDQEEVNDEPAFDEVAPRDTVRFDQSNEEEAKEEVAISTSPHLYVDEEEESEDDDEKEEEEEPVVERFPQPCMQLDDAPPDSAQKAEPEEQLDLPQTEPNHWEEQETEASEEEQKLTDLEVVGEDLEVRVDEEMEEKQQWMEEAEEEEWEMFPDETCQEVCNVSIRQEQSEAADVDALNNAQCTPDIEIPKESNDPVAEPGHESQMSPHENDRESQEREEGAQKDQDFKHTELHPEPQEEADHDKDGDVEQEELLEVKEEIEVNQTSSIRLSCSPLHFESPSQDSETPALSTPSESDTCVGIVTPQEITIPRETVAIGAAAISTETLPSNETKSLAETSIPNETFSNTATTAVHMNLLSPNSGLGTLAFQLSATDEESKVASCDTTVEQQDGKETIDEVREGEEEQVTPSCDTAVVVEEDISLSPDGEEVNQSLECPNESKIRFTVAPAWQRSLSSGEAKETLPSSPMPPLSTGPGDEDAQEAGMKDPRVAAQVEICVKTTVPGGTADKAPNVVVPDPVGAHTSAATAKEESPVVMEGNYNSPFGVRLRKTSVLHRFSSEEENTEAPAETPARPVSCKVEVTGFKPSTSQPVGTKPALPKKPDVHGETGVKSKRVSEPAAARAVSAVSEGPSWISMARQKQKIYKENSLDEMTIKKEDQDRESSLPSYVSSESKKELGTKPPEFTGNVNSSVMSKSSSTSENETRKSLSPVTPVPPQPPKSQLLPSPVSPKSPLPSSTFKPAPQAANYHRSLSPPTPVPVPIKPPSGSKPPTEPKPAQTPHTTLSSPPFSSRINPPLPASRVPGLSGPSAASQRVLPPPSLPQDEPPWMALAKKKAKAWSEMPQIVQ